MAKEDVLRQLETVSWRGNIRELRSFVEKACLDALFAADAGSNRARKIILTRETVENRLNKKMLRLDGSPSSPVSRGTWPQFRAGERLDVYLGMIETELLNTALENTQSQ